MGKQLVTATKPLKDKATGEKIIDEATGKQKVLTASMHYDFGETLQESVDLFGENVVHSAFASDARISLQGLIRGALDRGEDPEGIATRLASWKPGVTMPRISDPVAALKAQFDACGTEEEKRAIVEKVIAAAGLAPKKK